MRKAVIPVLLIISVTLAGCSAKGSADTEVEEKVIPVETMQISNGTISRELVYAGQVKPLEQVTVVPKIGGKVAGIYFDVGDRVKVDDILFSIDATDVNSQIASATAQYSAAQAGIASAQAGVATAQAGLQSVAGAQTETQLLQLETGVKNAELGLENAVIAVSNAKLSYDNVSTSYQNAKILYSSGTMSKTDFDKIELGYNQALAGYEQAQLAESQARTALEQAQESYRLYKEKTIGTSVKQAQSSVNQAQSGANQAAASAEASRVALENAQRNLDDLQVKSPLSGVVSAKNVTVGGMAGQGTPAFTVINIDTVEISTNVSEELINVIEPGMYVSVYINAAGSEPFNGVISTISPAADEIKNTYPVEITVSNSDGVLKPGMFAEVHFTKEKSENTVVMPRNAVLSEDGGSYVFVAEGGTAKKYIVETGIDNGEDIEITGGLPQGAQIITKGQTQVADGEKIKIVGSK